MRDGEIGESVEPIFVVLKSYSKSNNFASVLALCSYVNHFATGLLVPRIDRLSCGGAEGRNVPQKQEKNVVPGAIKKKHAN